jgi:hypothetical protein
MDSSSPPLSRILTPERALIFRITHLRNVPWILRNGLVCANGSDTDPDFVSIGNPDLIAKRPQRVVGIPPGGTLADYVPFYFTPKSPMLLNIKTGWGGVRQRPNEEIVILVSSLKTLFERRIEFVFTDRHAYLVQARFYSDLGDLERVDFDSLQRSDFVRNPEEPERFDRYQAEALVFGGLPVGALTGIGCYTRDVKLELEALAREAGAAPRIEVRPDWYFR